MAIGSKLGKVFGAIGSGLSFIPGPWSALGIAFSAASTAAEQGGAVKQRRDEERLAEQQQQGQQQRSAPIGPEGGERAQTRQIGGMAEQSQSQMTPPPIFRQGKPNLGGYQLQIDQEIADMLIKDVGGLYGES